MRWLEKFRPTMGPLRPESVAAVGAFSRCGDLAAGFTRLVCATAPARLHLQGPPRMPRLPPAPHPPVRQPDLHHLCLPVPRAAKLVSDHKTADLKNRQRLAEPERSGDRQPTAAWKVSEANQYLLRAPFLLQKTTWIPETRTVIDRSRCSWYTEANFQVVTATDFLAAVIDFAARPAAY